MYLHRFNTTCNEVVLDVIIRCVNYAKKKNSENSSTFPFFSYICTLYCIIGIKVFLGRKTN